MGMQNSQGAVISFSLGSALALSIKELMKGSIKSKGVPMGLFDKLKGLGASLVNSAVSINNKDLMEAMVAAGTIVAYADGDCSDEEVSVVSAILGSSKQLEAFGDEPAKVFDKYCDKMEASKRMGKNDLMKEIKDVAGNEEDSVRVLIMAIEVADADDNIDADEMKTLEAIAKALSLNLSDYLQQYAKNL